MLQTNKAQKLHFQAAFELHSFKLARGFLLDLFSPKLSFYGAD
jgi:hypothetical protein